MKSMLIDKKFRVPRIWSNEELKKFSHLFSGKIINVSGWIDIDKEGKTYKNYFNKHSEYFISNFKKEARGFQGNIKNEFFLDLEKKLPEKLINEFDVVFNHTTLEHIFKIEMAFKNLCLLSKDIVILVVPFLQEQHADYGDYWRFTPLTIKKLFDENKVDLIYLNYNDVKNSSIYIFAIGSKKKTKWKKIINDKNNKIK
ncbi:MAG: hypothetical protein AB7V77_05500, partial [Candidatus Woesearchaeota archaeon]